MTALIFLGALIAPLFYAMNNHIDKVLLEKYFKDDGGVGTLMMFSSLLSAAILPILLYIEPAAMQIGMVEAATLVFVGFLNIVLLFCYLKAMDEEEPTVVIIFYQLVPAIGLFLGYVVLGETVSVTQLVAMALVIAGASVMTIASDTDGKFTIKFKTLGYMLIASFCWAGESTLFKMVALEENVVRSLFWESLSLASFGVVMFAFIPSYRKSFLAVFKTEPDKSAIDYGALLKELHIDADLSKQTSLNRRLLKSKARKVISLNFLNEALYMAGNAAASVMVVKILVGINLMMNSFQPIFVFAIGLVLNKFWPGIATEQSGGRIWQKVIAIILTGVGVFLIGDWE